MWVFRLPRKAIVNLGPAAIGRNQHSTPTPVLGISLSDGSQILSQDGSGSRGSFQPKFDVGKNVRLFSSSFHFPPSGSCGEHVYSACLHHEVKQGFHQANVDLPDILDAGVPMLLLSHVRVFKYRTVSA